MHIHTKLAIVNKSLDDSSSVALLTPNWQMTSMHTLCFKQNCHQLSAVWCVRWFAETIVLHLLWSGIELKATAPLHHHHYHRHHLCVCVCVCVCVRVCNLVFYLFRSAYNDIYTGVKISDRSDIQAVILFDRFSKLNDKKSEREKIRWYFITQG